MPQAPGTPRRCTSSNADVEAAVEQRADLGREDDRLRAARARADAHELVRHSAAYSALRVRRQQHADRVVLHVRGDRAPRGPARCISRISSPSITGCGVGALAPGGAVEDRVELFRRSGIGTSSLKKKRSSCASGSG